jgi:hypothetical protein
MGDREKSFDVRAVLSQWFSPRTEVSLESSEDHESARATPSKEATNDRAPLEQGAEQARTPAHGGKRIDRLMTDLLQTHDGLFLGEAHNQPAMEQSVTKLLPMLKAAGVGTLSIELPQSVVDSVHVNQSYDDYRGTCGPHGLKKTTFALVQAAKRLELKVIGHESAAFAAHVAELIGKSEELRRRGKAREAEALLLREAGTSITIESVSKRDAWAEGYIRQHRQGKVVVIGGKAHSGHYTPTDAAGAEREDGALKGGTYGGLDIRLNFPSIDFKNASTVGEIGTTENGKPFSDYIVRLPTDLQKESIASWPLAEPADKRVFNPFEDLSQFPGEQPPMPFRGNGRRK